MVSWLHSIFFLHEGVRGMLHANILHKIINCDLEGLVQLFDLINFHPKKVQFLLFKGSLFFRYNCTIDEFMF